MLFVAVIGLASNVLFCRFLEIFRAFHSVVIAYPAGNDACLTVCRSRRGTCSIFELTAASSIRFLPHFPIFLVQIAGTLSSGVDHT